MFTSSLFILETIIGFSLLVFVHELGHFLAAKFQGIRAEVFSIGFGPALKKKIGDTEYRLSLIPLGGYVKLAGEEPSPDHEPKSDEFFGRPVGQRAIVLGAGVVMNVLFGIVLFIVAYQIGVPVIPAEVGEVASGSPAWHAGLREGDVITRIDDLTQDFDFNDLRTKILLANRGESLSLVVRRNGEELDVALKPEYREELGAMYAGVGPPTKPIVADQGTRGLRRRMALEAEREHFDLIYQAGLQGGDRITAVRLPGEDEPTRIESPAQFGDVILRSGGNPVEIFFERDGRAMGPVEFVPVGTGDELRRIGVTFGPTNRLETVRPGSWAEAAGLREGDRIVSVGERETRSGEEVFESLEDLAGAPVEIGMMRNGEEITVEAPAVRPEEPEWVMAFAEGDRFVSSVLTGYPADEKGIQPGDRIVAVEGEPRETTADVVGAIAAAGDQAVSVTWERDGERFTAQLTPRSLYVVPVAWQPYRETLQTGVLKSVTLGTRKSFQWILRIYAMLKGLLTRSISVRHLSGPIGIVYITYTAAQGGLGTLLYFLAVISVNLGVVNLLPIPILDGGHLLFAAIEKARGKPVNERVRGIANYVGLALLLCVFLVAFWNDIRNLFLS